MEPESVDAIITDPPYGINYVSQTGASIKNDKSPFIWFLYDAFRVLKSGESGHGGLICFTRWDVEQTFIDAMKIAGFNVKSEVIWDKVYHGMGVSRRRLPRRMRTSSSRSRASTASPAAVRKTLSPSRRSTAPRWCIPPRSPWACWQTSSPRSQTGRPHPRPLCRERLHAGRGEEDGDGASSASSWMTNTSPPPSGASRR